MLRLKRPGLNACKKNPILHLHKWIWPSANSCKTFLPRASLMLWSIWLPRPGFAIRLKTRMPTWIQTWWDLSICLNAAGTMLCSIWCSHLPARFTVPTPPCLFPCIIMSTIRSRCMRPPKKPMSWWRTPTAIYINCPVPGCGFLRSTAPGADRIWPSFCLPGPYWKINRFRCSITERCSVILPISTILPKGWSG